MRRCCRPRAGTPERPDSAGLETVPSHSRFPDASLSARMRAEQCCAARAARRRALSGARRRVVPDSARVERRRRSGKRERRRPESNWCARLCRPLPNHSATAPEGRMVSGLYCRTLSDSSAVGQRQKSRDAPCWTRVHEPRERLGVPVSLPGSTRARRRSDPRASRPASSCRTAPRSAGRASAARERVHRR